MTTLSPEHKKTPDGARGFSKRKSANSLDTTTLQDAIMAAGMRPPQHIPCGAITRFPGIGKKSSNRAGWCWRSDDCGGAAYGDYSTGLRETWQATGAERSQIDWQVMRKVQRQRIAVDEARYQSKAGEVREIWASLCEAPPVFAYFVAKQIEKFSHLFRTHEYNGRLCVVAPLEYRGAVVNIQHISERGGKWPYPGARWAGAYCVVQRPYKHTHLILCEGVATGCTLATLDPTAVVVAALNKDNLLPVARDIRRVHPNDRAIIAADNDRYTDGNPGKTKAIEAARAIGAEYSVPEFPPGVPGTDFNDLYCAGCLS